MSSHRKPEEIRKSLTHPVLDGDGHWVEYAPVFAEQIRKVTGDLGANGFLQSQRRGPDALSMTPQQRAEKGVAMEGFCGRQSTTTRERAAVMVPRMLHRTLSAPLRAWHVVALSTAVPLPRRRCTQPARGVTRASAGRA